MKASFILHHEQRVFLDAMTDEQAGKLIKLIFEHSVNGSHDKSDDPAVMFAMIAISMRMDSDRAAYDKKCAKNREVGALGGRPANKPNGYSGNRTVILETQLAEINPSDIDSDIDSDSNAFKDTDVSSDPSAAKPKKARKEKADPRPTACPPEKWEKLVTFSRKFHEDRAATLGNIAPFTEKKVTGGAKALDTLTRLRGIDSREVQAVLAWAQGDSFWNDNIRSLASLLKLGSNGETKYANILAAMRRDVV